MTWILTLFLFADLSSIKSLPDLEKRSELALANADQEVDAARTAYKAGDVKKMQEALRGGVEATVVLREIHGSEEVRHGEVHTSKEVRESKPQVNR